MQRRYDVLWGLVLLPKAHRWLEPEMAAFLGLYLFSLSYDFDEVLQREEVEQEALLKLTVGELADLVRELKRRVAQGQPGSGGPQLQIGRNDERGPVIYRAAKGNRAFISFLGRI